MIDTVVRHSTVFSLGAYYVASAAVSSLPPPQDDSSEFYKWFYKFANTVAANATALRGKQGFEAKGVADVPPKV